MEDILDIYELPYTPVRPVVCMDEKPYQLLGETRKPLSMRTGDNRKVDSEYTRNGTCSNFAFVEPLAGKHHVNVREHQTAVDWAEKITYLADTMYPDAEKIILVMIKLNVMTRQCLSRRIDDINNLRSKLAAWETERNTMAAKVNWQLKTSDARIKLSSLYPKFTAASM